MERCEFACTHSHHRPNARGICGQGMSPQPQPSGHSSGPTFWPSAPSPWPSPSPSICVWIYVCMYFRLLVFSFGPIHTCKYVSMRLATHVYLGPPRQVPGQAHFPIHGLGSSFFGWQIPCVTCWVADLRRMQGTPHAESRRQSARSHSEPARKHTSAQTLRRSHTCSCLCSLC